MIDENVGETGRILRLGSGAIALFFGVVVATVLGRALLGWFLALVGAAVFGAGLVRRCPINYVRNVDAGGRNR